MVSQHNDRKEAYALAFLGSKAASSDAAAGHLATISTAVWDYVTHR